MAALTGFSLVYKTSLSNVSGALHNPNGITLKKQIPLLVTFPWWIQSKTHWNQATQMEVPNYKFA